MQSQNLQNIKKEAEDIVLRIRGLGYYDQKIEEDYQEILGKLEEGKEQEFLQWLEKKLPSLLPKESLQPGNIAFLNGLWYTLKPSNKDLANEIASMLLDIIQREYQNFSKESYGFEAVDLRLLCLSFFRKFLDLGQLNSQNRDRLLKTLNQIMNQKDELEFITKLAAEIKSKLRKKQ